MTAAARKSEVKDFVDVRMSELQCSKAAVTFRSLLGSCIGLVLYDPVEKVGGMAHIMLPAAGGQNETRGKFVDTAVAELISQLTQLGGQENRLTARIAGGAGMFDLDGGSRIGDRNLEAVQTELRQRAIRITGAHCGGNQGRRMMFCVATGRVTVQVVGDDVVEI